MAVTLSITQTGVPKRTILDMAFEACGLAGFDFERTAEEIAAALRKLNAMMAEWPWNLVTYNAPTYGDGLAEEASNLPANATNAVADELAMRIAPGLGLSLSAEQRAARAASRAQFMAAYATTPAIDVRGGTPLGSGHLIWRRFSAQV